jgi:nitrous oxidase accessory protein
VPPDEPPVQNDTNSTTPPISNGTNITPTTIVNGGSIQTAIDNAKTGDIIQVNAGSYSGFSINKAVTVIANGIVNVNSPVTMSGTGGTLNGFRITADYAVAISNSNHVSVLNNIIKTLGQTNAIMDTGTNDYLTILGNTIIGGDMMYGNGMAFEGVTSNSLVENNTISNTLHGILFDVASTNNIIKNNKVYGNGLITNGEAGIDYQGAGIYTVDGSTNFQILNNYVSGERDGIALQQIGSSSQSGFVVQGNTVENNINGLWMTISNSLITQNIVKGNINGIDLTGTNNQITNNQFINNSNCDVALTTSKSSDVNTLSGNTGATKFYNVGAGKVIGE